MGITRRRVLQTGLALGGLRMLAPLSSAVTPVDIVAALQGEDLIAYVQRVAGGWDLTLYRRLLGAANEWKEGDEIIGVAAKSQTERDLARTYHTCTNRFASSVR